MLTILDVLRNAEMNLNNGPLGPGFAKPQLSNAIALLEKGYAPNDDFNALVSQHGSVDAVPEKG